MHVINVCTVQISFCCFILKKVPRKMVDIVHQIVGHSDHNYMHTSLKVHRRGVPSLFKT